MKDILKLARIQIYIIILFVFGKGVLRPYILEGDFPLFMDIFVLSLPNFFEGITGVLSLTFIGLYLNHRFNKHRLSNSIIYLLAVILATVFVLTQEFKLHNLGGNNVYDPYDVLFSIVGLGIGYLIILKLKPDFPVK
jgi:hypothetical protein